MAIIMDPSSQPQPGGPTANDPVGGGQGAGGGDVIKESNEQSFMVDVIETSMSVPVIVDFWAPWCGPCKTLGPMLEKIVREQQGAVRMVKVNVDENQQIAGQLQVKSIPTVFAFSQGQPVDAFQGAVPESELRAFVKKLTGGQGSPLDAALDQAEEAMSTGDIETASAIFQQVLAHDTGNARGIAGTLRIAVMTEDLEGARAFVDSLDDATLKLPEVTAAITALELAEQANAGPSVDLSQFEAGLEAAPDNHQMRFDYAIALTGAAMNEEAVDQLIEIIRRDRTWNEEAARAQLLKIFESLGFSDPVAVDGRKKLSAVLFS